MVSSARQTLRRIVGSDQSLPSLLIGAVLALAGPLGSYAADQSPSLSTENPLSELGSGATPRPATSRMPRHHHSTGEVIDANVHRLARGLELDPRQQNTLRGILVDHYQALTKLRTDAAPGQDRSGAMRAIVERTRERIRAMLNESQKQKYSTDVSTGLAGASRADLEHWLDVRDAATTQAAGPSAKEN